MTTGIPRKLEAVGRGPAPWAPRKARAGGALTTPAAAPPPRRAPRFPAGNPALPRRAGRSRATRAPRHPPRPIPGGRGFERRPRAEAAGGSLPYGTWGRRWTGQRRPRRLEAEARAEEEVPGTPPPIVPARPAARNGPLRRPASAPYPARCQPLPCSGRLSPPLTLLIPGKLERAPGANPQTKSETSAAGREWLLVGALPLLPPHPLPAVSRAVP